MGSISGTAYKHLGIRNIRFNEMGKVGVSGVFNLSIKELHQSLKVLMVTKEL